MMATEKMVRKAKDTRLIIAGSESERPRLPYATISRIASLVSSDSRSGELFGEITSSSVRRGDDTSWRSDSSSAAVDWLFMLCELCELCELCVARCSFGRVSSVHTAATTISTTNSAAQMRSGVA